MSNLDVKESRRPMHGKGLCLVARTVSTVAGVLLAAQILASLFWGAGLFAVFALLPALFLLAGWRWHLAGFVGLLVLAVPMLGASLLWELHWSGWSRDVITATAVGLGLALGATLNLAAWVNDRRNVVVA